MTLKELFVTGWWSERHQSHVRPLWAMAVNLLLFLIYVPARAFVEWADKR